MHRKATIVHLGQAKKTPPELQGFLNFRAGLDKRELKGNEQVAILRIEGTDSHHAVFLEKGTTIEQIEKSLAAIEAVPDPKSRQALARALEKPAR